jgi:CTP synthase (UTP-ammonia lyase)
MDVDVRPGTTASDAYRRPRATERFYCNFGLNPDYAEALVAGGLVISGTDQDGAVRILEHPGLRFFMGTLFVPQVSSSHGAPHPLLVAFVSAAAGARIVRSINASNEASAQTLSG